MAFETTYSILHGEKKTFEIDNGKSARKAYQASL